MAAIIGFGRGANPLKKKSGKLNDYWLFVNEEGRNMFYRTHGRPFNSKDEADCAQMSQIWQGISLEKRENYKKLTTVMNVPELVRQRKTHHDDQYRKAQQNIDRTTLHRKRQQQLHKEKEHHNRVYNQHRPPNEGDLQLYTTNSDNPIFFNEKMWPIKRKKLFDNAVISLKFGCTNVERPEDFLKQHTLILIKVNIYDAVYVSEAYEARTHPSEVSMCVFNLSDGVKRTHSLLIKFEGQMLYNVTEGIPEDRYDTVNRLENETGLFTVSDHPRRTIYDAFEEIHDLIRKEYPRAIPVVQCGDWNKVVGSLFFLAHAGRKAAEFKELLTHMSTIDDHLLALGSVWNEKKGGGKDYKPIDEETLVTRLQRPLQPIMENSRFYCENHIRMTLARRVNCGLARCSSSIHNFYLICAESNIADWRNLYNARKSDGAFSLCKSLEQGLSVVKDHAEKVVASVIQPNDDSDGDEILSSDDEDEENISPSMERLVINSGRVSPERSSSRPSPPLPISRSSSIGSIASRESPINRTTPNISPQPPSYVNVLPFDRRSTTSQSPQESVTTSYSKNTTRGVPKADLAPPGLKLSGNVSRFAGPPNPTRNDIISSSSMSPCNQPSFDNSISDRTSARRPTAAMGSSGLLSNKSAPRHEMEQHGPSFENYDERRRPWNVELFFTLLNPSGEKAEEMKKWEQMFPLLEEGIRRSSSEGYKTKKDRILRRNTLEHRVAVIRKGGN